MSRETDGNPFFVGELLRHLGESGAFVQDATGRYSLSAESDDVGLPSSVLEVVQRRVARLGADAVQLLAAAAVIGRDFDIDVLARAADVDEDDLLDVLERATAAAIVIEDPTSATRYRFVHTLVIAHTLVTGLSAARRRRTHERVAVALEAAGGSPEELARHWLLAVKPADADKAVSRMPVRRVMPRWRPSRRGTRWAGTSKLWRSRATSARRCTCSSDWEAQFEASLEDWAATGTRAAELCGRAVTPICSPVPR